MATKVVSRSENITKTIVRARDFEMVIDEPPRFAGKDEGPTPIEYMFAALAGCLSVMGHLIAREMEFELKGLQIELEGDLDPARLMGKSTSVRAGVEGIHVKVIPDTDADEEVLKEWMVRVEDRCPVTDNLVNITPITFEVG